MAEEGAGLRRAEVLAQLALSQFYPVSLCLSLICSMAMRPHMVEVRIKCLGLKLYVLTNHKLLPNRQGSTETYWVVFFLFKKKITKPVVFSLA